MYENKAVEFVSMSSEAFKLTVSGSPHSDKLCYTKIRSSRPQLRQQGSTVNLSHKRNAGSHPGATLGPYTAHAAREISDLHFSVKEDSPRHSLPTSELSLKFNTSNTGTVFIVNVRLRGTYQIIEIFNILCIYKTSFPNGSAGKESAFNAGDTGDESSMSGSGRSPGGEGDPLQYSCLENLTEKPGGLLCKGPQSRTQLSD